MPLTRLKKPARFMDVYETYKCWDPQSLDLPFGPSPWTSLWTQSMGYPCGPPLIFEDKFYQRSKWIFKHLKRLLSYELLLLYHCSNFLKHCSREEVVSYTDDFFLCRRIVYPLQTLFYHWQTYWILLMDQAENDLHITVLSVELVRRLTNIVWK